MLKLLVTCWRGYWRANQCPHLPERLSQALFSGIIWYAGASAPSDVAIETAVNEGAEGSFACRPIIQETSRLSNRRINHMARSGELGGNQDILKRLAFPAHLSLRRHPRNSSLLELRQVCHRYPCRNRLQYFHRAVHHSLRQTHRGGHAG